MYLCEQCGKQTSSGDKEKKIVKYRQKTYNYKIKKGKKVIEKQSSGFEIEKEYKICKTCFNNIEHSIGT